MCRTVPCTNEGCGKLRWVGCGQHLQQLANSNPKDSWCNCEDFKQDKEKVSKYYNGTW